MRRLPGRWLTPRIVVLAVGGRHRPGVARRSRWWSVSGRLTEAAARLVPVRGTAAEARRVGHPAGRAQDQGPAAPVRHRTAVACSSSFASSADGLGAAIRRDEVDRRPGGHRRLGGSGRFGPRCRRLEVGFFRACPAEFSPQCVVAVGHYRSPSVSDDAVVDHSQVSTTPGPTHRIRRPGCAATVQQIPTTGHDGR